MQYTYLGLGTNIGDREDNLYRAMKLINETYTLIDYSSIYITSPVGFSNQPDFLNMVIVVDTGRDEPFQILTHIKKVEKKLGRKPTIRWGPRIIDIDILYIDGINLHTESLQIPHKELFNRDFVLVPLSELIDYIIINEKRFILYDYITHRDLVEVYKKKEHIIINV